MNQENYSKKRLFGSISWVLIGLYILFNGWVIAAGLPAAAAIVIVPSANVLLIVAWFFVRFLYNKANDPIKRSRALREKAPERAPPQYGADNGAGYVPHLTVSTEQFNRISTDQTRQVRFASTLDDYLRPKQVIIFHDAMNYGLSKTVQVAEVHAEGEERVVSFASPVAAEGVSAAAPAQPTAGNDPVIIFDLFGVFFEDAFEAWLAKHQLQRTGSFADLSAAYDAGSINEAAFCREVSSAAGQTLTPQDLKDGAALKPDMVAFAEHAHHYYRTCLLSNGGGPFVRKLLKEHGLESLFDDIFISGETGLIKPHYEAFENVLTHTGAVAKQVVFIDDTTSNVVAARSMGMQAFLFTSREQLESTLAVAHVLPLLKQR